MWSTFLQSPIQDFYYYPFPFLFIKRVEIGKSSIQISLLGVFLEYYCFPPIHMAKIRWLFCCYLPLFLCVFTCITWNMRFCSFGKIQFTTEECLWPKETKPSPSPPPQKKIWRRWIRTQDLECRDKCSYHLSYKPLEQQPYHLTGTLFWWPWQTPAFALFSLNKRKKLIKRFKKKCWTKN